MKCPYCISEIDDAALACPHCTRDLTLLRPLLQKIETLETSLQARIDELAQRIIAPRVDAAPVFSAPQPSAEAPAGVLREWFLALLTPLLFLLIAHLLITQIWDARDWVLYATSIAIPFLPGLRLMRLRQRPLIAAALGGLLMASVAVFAMSAFTGIIDKSDWLPTDTRSWRELANYALSIALSFVAGGIVGQLLRERADRLEAARARAIELLSSKTFSPDNLQQTMERINSIGKALLALATTGASVYSGLGRFIANG